MAKEETVRIKWLRRPEAHDYPAARSYLRLLYDDSRADALVEALKREKVTKFKSKDIFRASRLSLLGISNSHVKKDRRKIRNGASLSPLLLVRDPAASKVVIADGYHRLCAVYSFNEDLEIPCKIV